MKHMIEKLLLFLLCLALLLPNFHITHCCVACLIILTLSNLSYYADNGALTLAMTILMTVMVWFLPALGTFLPIMAYDAADPKLSIPERTGAYFCIVLALFIFFSHAAAASFLVLLFLIPVAVFMRIQSNKIDSLYETIRKNRDSDRELQLLLEQKNANLIQKADYEIEMATLRERNRIAREIHDNVGHLLTRSILQIGALNTINKDKSVTLHYEQISTTLNQAMDSIRTSVHDLYHPGIELCTSIESFIKNISKPEIHLHYKVEQISQSLTFHFLAIIKEAINNTLRHSNADTMQITLLEHPYFYQLLIEDNGTCVPPDFQFSGDLQNGIGLSGMQNRILSLHGTMEIFTKKGFKIFISVPKSNRKNP